ncbi:Rieske (2Fe-2S) protein [Halobaculum sp. MBLA0143]|uniref:Rieske (2Fe-2S) protein n=1 Tax=Halobaculum sp. MBLA0143 TaxID=3079933 RepID=UPI00352691A2
MSQTEVPDGYHEAVELSTLTESGRELVQIDGTAVVLFHHEGEVRAVNNRCPHMGFPLTEGSVEDGVLTCEWHHARFELSCGDTFDPWADDVDAYPTTVVDGTVYVDPSPQRDVPPATHWRERLGDGLEQNLDLVVAKASVGLIDVGVDPTEAVREGVTFGTQYRQGGWSTGLTILVALANVQGELAPTDRKRALFQGLRSVADDCADQPPKFEQEEFTARDVPFERLLSWFRENVEVRDPDGAERVLRTAVASDCTPEQLTRMLTTAATDHRYLDRGHTFDFVNKATEALDLIGWEHADDVLASLVRGLATADRAEERSSWRQPVDLAGRCRESFDRLDDLVAAGADESWTADEATLAGLLSDDPDEVFETLETAIEGGATPAELAGAVARAATRRIVLFGTGNEFSDWDTVLHTFTYANAVHRATQRTDARELYRGVFDAAVNVYLDRFLTTPPAPEPDPDPDGDPEACLDELREAFETRGRVNAAGSAAAQFLAAGGDPAELKQTLGAAVVQEDTGFHTFQVLEAGFRQFDHHYDDGTVGPVARDALVAVARYAAAHFPTRREREQTFSIAARLLRGETVHGGDDTDGADTATADD